MSTAWVGPDPVAFVLQEAELLDSGQLEAWNGLFAPEGHYWLPLGNWARDPRLEASHVYDDHLLREVRIARLRSRQAHSQQPPGACHHLLQQPRLVRADAIEGRCELRTAFLYTELRAGHTVSLPGVAWHHLRLMDGALRIVLKRVDLLHAAEALPAVEFYP